MKRTLCTINSATITTMLVCGLISHNAVAVAPQASITKSSLPLMEYRQLPQLNLWGNTGSYTGAKGQLRFPFFGDNNHVFYGIADGNVVNRNNSWWVGAGLGYRKVIEQRIYGAYATANYNFSRNHNGFWVGNIGLESLGDVWDFYINGYFPLSANKKEYNVRVRKWADEFGIYDYIEHMGHVQTNKHASQEIKSIESIGSGIDFKVGRVIPGFNKAKVYVGGYYFSLPDNGQVKGVAAKLSYTVNKYASIELSQSFDNYNHAKTLVGLKLTFGGYNEQENKSFGIASRLLDPIDRGYIDAIVPMKKRDIYGEIIVEDKERKGGEVQFDNLWFFDPNMPGKSNRVEDGTFERPFTKITPENFNYIIQNRNVGSQYPMLYLASSDIVYNLKDFIGRDGQNYTLQLPYGYGIYGRSSDYRRPASGEERPELIGSIDFYGNNVLDGVYLTSPTVGMGYNPGKIINGSNGEPFNSAMRFKDLRGDKKVVLSNVELNVDGQQFNTAVWIDNSEVIMNGWHINIDSTGGKAELGTVLRGVYAENGSIMTLNGSKVKVNNISNAKETTYNRFVGIQALSTVINFASGANVVDGSNVITIDGQVGNKKSIKLDNYAIVGVDAINQTSINFLGGKNTIAVSAVGDVATGVELQDSNIKFGNSENNISATAQGRGTNVAYGVNVYGESEILFEGGKNIISSSSTGYQNNSYGIYNGDTTAQARILFKDGENSVIAKVKGDSVSDSRVVNATAIHLRSHGSSIQLLGGTNTIQAIAIDNNSVGSSASSSPTRGTPEVFAKAIDSWGDTLFDGGKNIVSADVDATFCNATAFTIESTEGAIIFRGGYDNQIIASAVSYNANAYSTGISLRNYRADNPSPVVKFISGNNLIQADAKTGRNNIAEARGIMLSNYVPGSAGPAVEFHGGKNDIGVMAYGWDNVRAAKYGIKAGAETQIRVRDKEVATGQLQQALIDSGLASIGGSWRTSGDYMIVRYQDHYGSLRDYLEWKR
jgi:hypothetical protein